MDITRVKKELYKQKPKALFSHIRKGYAYYNTNLVIDDQTEKVMFEIPISDMGDSDFHYEMESQRLNRWILVTEESNPLT